MLSVWTDEKAWVVVPIATLGLGHLMALYLDHGT